MPIVGSGPFQTVEFKKDEYVKMVRNPTYWGKQPTVDEIVFQYYTNTDTMVQDLKSGTIDGAQVIPPEQFKRLEGEPGHQDASPTRSTTGSTSTSTATTARTRWATPC